MPRKSLAAHLVPTPSVTGTAVRLHPPAHISEAELTVWLELVNDQPADAFTSTHVPMLELYCRHIVQARVISDEIALFERAWLADDDGLKRFDRLLAMRERETRAASSLATRLRITRQSMDHATVARKFVAMPRKARPWELPK